VHTPQQVANRDPLITLEVNMKAEPKKIRVTMTYDREMNWERFWSWVDLTVQQINNGRQQRMIDLGQLTFQPITRDDFQVLVRNGALTFEDDLGAFGKLSTIFTYEVLETEEDKDEGTGDYKLPESLT
jgi:hypothetical protein